MEVSTTKVDLMVTANNGEICINDATMDHMVVRGRDKPSTDA